MSATTRYIVRGSFVGVVALLASLQAALPGLDGGELLQAIIAGVVALGAYLGIGAATPVEPSVGKKSA